MNFEPNHQESGSRIWALLITTRPGTKPQSYFQCLSLLICQMGGWLTAFTCYDCLSYSFLFAGINTGAGGGRCRKGKAPRLSPSFSANESGALPEIPSFYKPKLSRLQSRDDNYCRARVKITASEGEWQGFVFLRYCRVTWAWLDGGF